MADDEHSKKAKKPSGALNVERRTWDLEHFQEVAKERLEKVCSACDPAGVGFSLRFPFSFPPDPPPHHTLPLNHARYFMPCLFVCAASIPFPFNLFSPTYPIHPTAQQEASGESEKKKPGFVRKREEFQSAEQGAAGPEGSKRAYLKHREADLGLEDKVGKIQVVTGSSAPHQQGGYWCDICQCLLKDSMAYLDHINGKKHQKALGFSMRVERVGVDRVKERLGALKRREEERRNAGPRESAIKVYERKLEEEGAVKEQWKEARKEARRKIAQRAAEEEDDGEGGGRRRTRWRQ